MTIRAALACSLNADRRHLTADERQAFRQARIARVADWRRQGYSLRDIAEKEGVSEKQVRLDLEAISTAEGYAVEPEGGKVNSRDGKARPAKRDPEKARQRAEKRQQEKLRELEQATPNPCRWAWPRWGGYAPGMPRRTTRPQLLARSIQGRCALCGDDRPEGLQAHRVVPGVPYSQAVLVCLCATCHVLHHAGRVQVVAVRQATAHPLGVVEWTDEQGQTRYSPVPGAGVGDGYSEAPSSSSTHPSRRS